MVEREVPAGKSVLLWGKKILACAEVVSKPAFSNLALKVLVLSPQMDRWVDNLTASVLSPSSELG